MGLKRIVSVRFYTGQTMTEQEWLAATDPTPMLEFVSGKATDRKLRLFAVACCNQADDEHCQRAVLVAEEFADGEAEVGVLEEARARVTEVLDEYPDAHDAVSEAAYATFHATAADFLDLRTLLNASRHAAQSAAFAAEDRPEAELWTAAWLKDHRPVQEANAGRMEGAWAAFGYQARWQALRQQALWLRDIFGNPFRPAIHDPSWLTSTVVQLAQGIYQERAFDRMPILADALQDAGCDNAEILDHCRKPGPHVRGCWLVDLLLGKE